MVITETVARKVFEGLRGIGLNLYERNLYVALLVKKVATASELSDLSGVPRARAYDVLMSLEQKGFAVIQNGSPFRYVAVEPKDGFERMKINVLKKAENTSKRLEELKSSDIMRELTTLYKKDLKIVSPTEFSGVIKSTDKINLHIKSMLGNTNKYAKILTSEKGIEDLTYHLKHLSKLKKDGVSVRVIAPITSKNKSVVAELLPFIDIRDSSSLKTPYGKLHIYDGEHVLVGLTNDKETEPDQDAVFWTRSEHVAKDLMEPVFNTMWEKSNQVK